MKTETLLAKKLTEVLEKEKVRFSLNGGTLSEVYAKFSKIGINTKSTYSLPLKDTIGKTFREHIQFKKS